MTGYDYAAWSAPIDRADFAAFVSAAKARSQNPDPAGPGATGSRSGVNSGIALLVLGAFGLALGFVNLALRNNIVLVIAILIVGAAMFVIGGIGLISEGPKFAKRWRLYYRAARFARANGLEYLVQKPISNYDGLLLQLPDDKRDAIYAYTSLAAPVIEAGQMRKSFDAGRGRTQAQLWGYIVIDLPHSIGAPAILRSNAPGNNKIISLTVAQSIGTAFALSDSFTLYCPQEAEATARAVFFRPEFVTHVSALNARYGPVNAELYGNHLYVFSRKPFDMYDPTTVRLVFDTVAAAVPDPSGSSV